MTTSQHQVVENRGNIFNKYQPYDWLGIPSTSSRYLLNIHKKWVVYNNTFWQHEPKNSHVKSYTIANFKEGFIAFYDRPVIKPTFEFFSPIFFLTGCPFVDIPGNGPSLPCWAAWARGFFSVIMTILMVSSLDNDKKKRCVGGWCVC